MSDAAGPVLRLCEWGCLDTARLLTSDQREEIALAARTWREAHRLPKAPLVFEGTKGETLRARQYVGVVEAGGAQIEIYPKLDAALLDAQTPPPSEEKRASLLSNLLWMMEAASGGDDTGPLEADTATLAHDDTTFWDVFALLLARNLRRELINGVARRYQGHEDDLPAVRGRIRVGAQASRNFDRFDKIACAWDEFTPDIALNRVFRCACRLLHSRTRGREARRLLEDCLGLLDDVANIPASAALTEARRLTWDRTTERFRVPFALAVRLLEGVGHTLQTSDADTSGGETFVFLVDMNDLFERYVQAVLEARFGVSVQTQQPIGYLFPDIARGRIEQKPDFRWTDRDGVVWIADAKYKHLAKNQKGALTFDGIAASDDDTATLAAGRLISPDDVRQLTVYAELSRRDAKGATNGNPAPRLMLLYPFVGEAAACKADTATAWNGSAFVLAPIRVTQTEQSLAENFPF